MSLIKEDPFVPEEQLAARKPIRDNYNVPAERLVLFFRFSTMRSYRTLCKFEASFYLRNVPLEHKTFNLMTLPEGMTGR